MKPRYKARPEISRFSTWQAQVLLLLAFILFCLLAVSFYRSNMTFKTTEYTVKSPRIPNAFNGFKIAQISDLHGSQFGKDGEKLVRAVEEAKPNIVVITGDVISREERKPMDVLLSLKPIAAAVPTYYIRGNHEMYRDEVVADQGAFYAALQAAGITILENRTVPLFYQGARIDLVGLKEPLSSYGTGTVPDLSGLLSAPSERYTVLLAHNPLWFSAYRSWGADLVISGHVHGGVLRLPFFGGLLSPERRFFPRYDKGLYEEDRTTLVVSAGMGNSGLPVRLFNDMELVVITLESQSIR